MSSGSVPGSSGENMIYYLITGVAAFGALFYVSGGLSVLSELMWFQVCSGF